MRDPLGVSKGYQGTTRGKEKILLISVGIEPTTSRFLLIGYAAQYSESQPVRHFYHFSNQFGYDSNSTKTERIEAMESWAKENFPHSDSDPGHADAIVLITRRCVSLSIHL